MSEWKSCVYTLYNNCLFVPSTSFTLALLVFRCMHTVSSCACSTREFRVIFRCRYKVSLVLCLEKWMRNISLYINSTVLIILSYCCVELAWCDKETIIWWIFFFNWKSYSESCSHGLCSTSLWTNARHLVAVGRRLKRLTKQTFKNLRTSNNLVHNSETIYMYIASLNEK